MTNSTSTAELRTTWESAASGWAKWEAKLSAGLTEATEALIDMAGVKPGMRALDLACGAGVQTLRLADRVGPEGAVVACDISPTMLEHVRQSATRAGLENVATVESPAEELSETQDPFDAAICRLGLMLFASPQKALESVQRVLKPGARFAALVFTTPANNPFMAQSLAILLRHAGKSPPGPGQPGLFALGGEGVLEDLMRDSGFADIQTRKVSAQIALASAAEALEMMQEAFGVYRAVIADLSAAEKAQAWSDVSDFLKSFETEGGFMTEVEFLIGSGARPH